jgi:hypothetical protein
VTAGLLSSVERTLFGGILLATLPEGISPGKLLNPIPRERCGRFEEICNDIKGFL